MTTTITFKPSNVHQGHYVYINGEDTGIGINLYAYETIESYKHETNKKINKWKRKRNTKPEVY